MRRARVAYSGAVHDAVVEADGRTLHLADGRTVDESAVVWLPPVQPRTIVALGLNYADHAAELAFKAPDEPLVFLKAPGSLLGHKGVTRRAADANQMHHECELVAVIGRTASKVRREDALDYIGGWTVANDYAIREYLENYYRPNLRVKNRDGCTPIGPWVVDRDDIPNHADLAVRTRVNGKLVQDGSTKNLVFDVPYLVEYLTSFMTLSPGDIILTGTPHGMVFVQPGDVVLTEVEGVGVLENRLVGDNEFYNPGPETAA
ncbi:MAG TPA: fumarylacetoacetate hydrolase family protein [Caulobacteraceae bacterium]|jgi:5-oxopent-3-ene-1,2,5-tricarboxylate decarboxylase/2-hydroxyhepta-2,4-diene-1,7-dioate isomerase|nr:fumarylacetoacetate hydrolase family protein [Caulobacteraceae bacterium]